MIANPGLLSSAKFIPRVRVIHKTGALGVPSDLQPAHSEAWFTPFCSLTDFTNGFSSAHFLWVLWQEGKITELLRGSSITLRLKSLDRERYIPRRLHICSACAHAHTTFVCRCVCSHTYTPPMFLVMLSMDGE